MGNLQKSLLESIKTEIEINATLSYVNSAYIVPALHSDYLVDYFPEAPFCLIYPLGSTFTPVSMPDLCEDAVYSVGISYFEEFWGANVGVVGNGNGMKGVAEVEADLQSVFNRNTFSIAGLFSGLFQSAAYNPVGFTRIEEQSISQVHCSLQYLYSDYSERSASVFEFIMTPSAQTACVAGTTIPKTYPIMRLYGGSGNVIMTATPNVSVGVDGELCIWEGCNDSALVTLQSDNNLPNSGFKLQHGRNMTLGNNDSLFTRYRADVAAWIEISRADCY